MYKGCAVRYVVYDQTRVKACKRIKEEHRNKHFYNYEIECLTHLSKEWLEIQMKKHSLILLGNLIDTTSRSIYR